MAEIVLHLTKKVWSLSLEVRKFHEPRVIAGEYFCLSFVSVHYFRSLVLIIIIIMEICKAPTLRLKALNKHTHIMYIEMENVIQFFVFYISTSVQA